MNWNRGLFFVTSLLWYCSIAMGLDPEEPKGHQISPRMVESPHKCSVDGDCGDTEQLTCDLEHKVCKCRENFHVLSKSGGCLPARQLGEECAEDVQCRVLDRNATCEDKSCVCDSGFYRMHDSNGSLCSLNKTGSGSGSVTSSGVDQNMIIVLAVLAIMFVGICVAMHLMSKARFWNRRTIFNSPHPRLMHIKLGKRKKSSVRTQHLPPPNPHGGFAPRHHSFSGHHSPYPLPNVSKSRSHECLRSAISREDAAHFERRPKTAPLAERESLPSNGDLEKKVQKKFKFTLWRNGTREHSKPKKY